MGRRVCWWALVMWRVCRLEMRGGESVEEGKEHHGKDFGNVDAVDVGTEWHTHKHEKHMSEKSAVEKM